MVFRGIGRPRRRHATGYLPGDKEGAKLLGPTLEEERQTDQKLSKLAQTAVNVAAAIIKLVLNPQVH